MGGRLLREDAGGHQLQPRPHARRGRDQGRQRRQGQLLRRCGRGAGPADVRHRVRVRLRHGRAGRIPQRRASGRHARIRTVLERQERQGLRRLQGAVHGLRGPVAHRVQAARVRDRRVGHDRARQVQGRGERLRRRKHPAAVRPQGQGDLHGDVPEPLLDRQGLQLRQRLPHHLQPGENRDEHPGVARFEGR